MLKASHNTLDANSTAIEEAIKPYQKPILYQNASKKEITIDQKKKDTDVSLPDLPKKRAFRIIGRSGHFTGKMVVMY
ncbi:hypothetical protein TNIN_308161 [Trichonephila inaurata madagascariensis]|uniref:Uncharacterized protein n=1 Tax=Trichonephila inaurata madagascariensis TaxID=2747483 RepID=A0A8X7CNP1_9ARAC|nr:hypothetical protein TNIN_308161 [Trichonephila inaurata madagascariensis]